MVQVFMYGTCQSHGLSLRSVLSSFKVATLKPRFFPVFWRILHGFRKVSARFHLIILISKESPIEADAYDKTYGARMLLWKLFSGHETGPPPAMPCTQFDATALQLPLHKLTSYC